jgi:hypothetical protein
MDMPQLLLGQVGTVQYSRTREQLDQQSFTALWDFQLVPGRLHEYRKHTVHMAPVRRLSGRTEQIKKAFNIKEGWNGREDSGEQNA